jgi:hypothetical protein
MKDQTFRDFFERLSFPFWRERKAPCSVLKNLIREVESSSGDARSDARTKAKAWLISRVSSLGEEEILLAKVHFGYLLPSEWGLKPIAQQPCAEADSANRTTRVKTP